MLSGVASRARSVRAGFSERGISHRCTPATLVCTGTHWYTLVHNPVTLVLGFSVMCAVLKGLLSDTELKGTFISCAIPLRSTYSGTCVCSTSAVPHEQMHHCKSDVWEECRRGAVQADGGAPTDASWSP